MNPQDNQDIQNIKETKQGGKKTVARRIARVLWLVFAIGVLVVAMFFILVYNGVIGYMPPLRNCATLRISSRR